jgi:hypothetical protein
LSDHLGFCFTLSGFFKTERFITKIPNKKTYKKITSELLNEERPTLFSLKKIITSHRDKLSTFRKTRVNFSKRVMRLLNSPKSIEEIKQILKSNFNSLLSSIEGLRLSTKSKQASLLLKNICKYNSYQKSGGPIVRRIFINDKVLNPKDSSCKIIEHYREAHKDRENHTELSETVEFPDLLPSDRSTIKWLCANFSRDKAVTFDGIEDSLFRIHAKCANSLPRNECPICSKKINFARKLWSAEFWNNHEHHNTLMPD